MRYWRLVSQRAWQDTAKVLKLDSREKIVTLVLGQMVIALILWLALGNANLISNLWTRVATTALPFLLFTPFYIWNFIAAPAAMADEASEQINRLTQFEDTQKLDVLRQVTQLYI